MNQIFAEQIVRDVLELRKSKTPSGGFRMQAVNPSWMSKSRSLIAARFEQLVPQTATLADVAQIARDIMPLLQQPMGRRP